MTELRDEEVLEEMSACFWKEDRVSALVHVVHGCLRTRCAMRLFAQQGAEQLPERCSVGNTTHGQDTGSDFGTLQCVEVDRVTGLQHLVEGIISVLLARISKEITIGPVPAHANDRRLEWSIFWQSRESRYVVRQRTQGASGRMSFIASGQLLVLKKPETTQWYLCEGVQQGISIARVAQVLECTEGIVF